MKDSIECMWFEESLVAPVNALAKKYRELSPDAKVILLERLDMVIRHTSEQSAIWRRQENGNDAGSA